MRAINSIIIHCSATPPTMDIGAQEIRQWHTRRGWYDIGYHFVIRRNGAIELGRPVIRPGAHARGYNDHSIGICLIGGLGAVGQPANNYTSAQITTLESITVLLTTLLDLTGEDAIMGHKDLPGAATSCPCFDVRAWWTSIHATNNNNNEGQQWAYLP